jgi:hypothetical protein
MATQGLAQGKLKFGTTTSIAFLPNFCKTNYHKTDNFELKPEINSLKQIFSLLLCYV